MLQQAPLSTAQDRTKWVTACVFKPVNHVNQNLRCLSPYMSSAPVTKRFVGFWFFCVRFQRSCLWKHAALAVSIPGHIEHQRQWKWMVFPWCFSVHKSHKSLKIDCHQSCERWRLSCTESSTRLAYRLTLRYSCRKMHARSRAIHRNMWLFVSSLKRRILEQQALADSEWLLPIMISKSHRNSKLDAGIYRECWGER